MKIDVVETGFLKLDGGAMFGVVPKKIWSRYNQADDNNLCTWSMRCLLIQEADRKILIDTGIGNKQDARFFSFFEPHGDQNLGKSLSLLGVHTEEITDVLLTHLHFDHVGGALIKENNQIQLQFPNATYWSNEIHYHWAIHPNAREKASFLPENMVPLKKSGQLRMIDIQKNDIRFTDTVTLRFLYGHTEAMMMPIIKLPNDKTLFYAADLIPSHGHIGLPYVMSYDVRPLETIKEKIRLFCDWEIEDHFLFFEHDKDIECCNLKRTENGRMSKDNSLKLSQLLQLS